MKNNKNLFIVNTYFQLITVVNMCLIELKNDCNEILLTDQSVEMEEKYNRLLDLNIFKKLYFIKAKQFNTYSKLKKTINYIITPRVLMSISNNYDFLYFFNYDYFTTLVYDKIKKYNSKIKCCKYDEGYISYLYETKNSKANELIRKILNKSDIDNDILYTYLYNPQLLCYETKFNIKNISSLNFNKENLLPIYNYIFQYKKNNILEKYIFFEESFFCDGKDIDDMELILKIANIVGRENLLIKLHPRNKIDRFKKYGIKTNKEIGIPWEVIQMNNDFSDKILMTISSGSVLASRLYFNENIKTFLLFNCTDKMSDMVNDKYLEYLEKVKENMGMENFYIPNNEKEFLEELKKIDNKNNFNEEI